MGFQPVAGLPKSFLVQPGADVPAIGGLALPSCPQLPPTRRRRRLVFLQLSRPQRGLIFRGFSYGVYNAYV